MYRQQRMSQNIPYNENIQLYVESSKKCLTYNQPKKQSINQSMNLYSAEAQCF